MIVEDRIISHTTMLSMGIHVLILGFLYPFLFPLSGFLLVFSIFGLTELYDFKKKENTRLV